MLGNVFAAPGWNGPNTITTGGWYKWPSVSNDGNTIVYLAPYTSGGKETKQIQLIEYKDGNWTTPVVLASNGTDYSGESWVSLPNTKFTHPIISGNGRVIAYLGTTPTSDQFNPYKFEIYISEKTDTGWGSPYVLPTGFSLHEQFLSMNYDGTVIAYVFATGSWSDDHKLYVSRKTSATTWGNPVLVSELNKGAPSHPSLSTDGTKLTWMQNNGLVYSEYNGIGWTIPQWLVTWKTTNLGYESVMLPKISADGNTIVYWLLTVENSIMVAMNVYAMKPSTTGWGAPVKLTATPVIPTSIYDSDPVVNFNGTKVIYQRNVLSGDSIIGSYLEITEFQNNAWTAPTPLTNPVTTGFDTSPVMTPDGKTLIYNAGGGEIRSMTSSTGSTGGNLILTVTKSGTGSGAVSATSLTCSGTSCTGTYPADSFVILTATPDQGSAFAGWSQYCSGKSLTCVVTMDANRHATATFNLPGPQPNTISLTGTVKDVSGNAISNALVEKAGDPLIYTATDASGSFVLYGLPKDTTFHLKISKDGFIPVYSSNFNSTEDIDSKRSFKLFTYMRMYENWGVQQGKSVINGVVADNANPQTGLSGATLTAVGGGGKTYPVTYENAATNLFGGSATSSNGHFYILDVDNGDTVKVTASLTGWAFPERTFFIHTEAMSEGSFFGTSTGPVYTISGSVKDLSSAKSIRGVLVTVKDVSGATTVATAITDASGNYTVTITSNGEYIVFASKLGYEDASPPDQPSVSEITDTSPNIVVNMLMVPSSALIPLVAGWNFISFPKDPSPNNTIAEVLKEVSSNVRVVWGYDNVNKVWLKYSLKTQNLALNTLDKVESGKGYWVYMNAAGTIDITNWADPSTTTITLYPGWNLTGYNGTGSTISLPASYIIIWNWSNGIWQAKQNPSPTNSTTQPLNGLNQGKAYWIKMELGEGQTANWGQE